MDDPPTTRTLAGARVLRQSCPMRPFQPVTLALAQMHDPVFLGVVLRSMAWALVAFMVLGAALARLTLALFGPHDWLAGILGVFGAALSAWLLFLPVAGIVATLFTERVADAVERRFYPGAAPGRAAPLTQQLWDGLALGAQILALQIAALALTPFLPGVSVLAGWAIAAWAIGRGLFVAVAMRRMSRPEAIRVYQRSRLPVLLPGVALALAGSVPLLNLLVPVVGTAAMVHVLQRY